MIRSFLVLAINFIVVLGGNVPTTATLVDQISPHQDTFISVSNPSSFWQQEFTVGISGQLAGIDIWMSNPDTSVNLEIYSGTGWQSGGAVHSGTFATTGALSSDWFYMDVSSANLNFNAGDQLVFGVNSGFFQTQSIGGSSPGAYSSGQLHFNGSLFVGGNFDLAFRTHIVTAAVPEPSSMLYFCGICIFGLRRNRFA